LEKLMLLEDKAKQKGKKVKEIQFIKVAKQGTRKGDDTAQDEGQR
jgi:hypothetical protein